MFSLLSALTLDQTARRRHRGEAGWADRTVWCQRRRPSLFHGAKQTRQVSCQKVIHVSKNQVYGVSMLFSWVISCLYVLLPCCFKYRLLLGWELPHKFVLWLHGNKESLYLQKLIAAFTLWQEWSHESMFDRLLDKKSFITDHFLAGDHWSLYYGQYSDDIIIKSFKQPR